MFIYTHSRESMIDSICAIFNISQLEWIDFMYEISQIIDDKDEYTLSQKQNHLIKGVLERLVDYQTNDVRLIFDDDNPILRLPDNYIVPSEYFVNKEKITYDMLK